MNLIYDNNEYTNKNIRYSIHQTLKNLVRSELKKSINSYEKIAKNYYRYYSDLVTNKEYNEVKIEELKITLDWLYKHDPTIFVDLTHSLSYYFFTHGHWQERINRAKQAVTICKKNKFQKKLAWSYINELGYVFMKQNNYSNAILYLEQGKKILETELELLNNEQNNLDSKDQLGVNFMYAMTFRYLGIYYTEQLNYVKAKDCFKKAFNIFSLINRNSIIANQKIEIGELYLKQEKNHDAIQMFEDAINYHKKNEKTKLWVLPWLARAYYGKGDAFMNNNNFSKAKKNYEIANKYLTQRRSDLEQVQLLYRLSILNHKLDKKNKALEFMNIALSKAKKLSNLKFVDTIEEQIVRIKYKYI